MIPANPTSNASPEAPRRDPVLRFDHHPREFRDHRHVYAVLSRRARGISIGINLNPDKSCNFGCIYCQVDRSVPGGGREVDEKTLLEELRVLLNVGVSGELARLAQVDAVPEDLGRVADVAFSGDGEPTTYKGLASLVRRSAALIEETGLAVPITLITNATLFHKPWVREALDELAACGGRTWAKLDAGSEGHYSLVNETKVPFARVLDNIREEAMRRPLTIQSLFLRLDGEGPARAEIEAYAGRLAHVVREGGKLAGVQVTTVARRPPRDDVSALPASALEEIARVVRDAIPGVPVDVFPGGANAPADEENAP